eukprot:CAMPEP_0177314622 /NCGR_PEP_ID=MMETSP0368-20130122/12025_1 /TAXON_ID=447022 ORGANISM="Scrippsiella hangoei-like, Strain SHHI-4" /NCGR_SAMPLE_ID=MMETSP0368 /ASSEMBLY_ACC=CAM_ASM_000363 /LENGTH=206 /DNA_ID=CAMNT_0018773769 /DNA_START=32 /DNA_END=649 /DNA_ORIENTATION=+
MSNPAIVETEGLGTRHAASQDVPALFAEPVVAHLLALELKPTALLAIVPAAAVPREVALATVHVLVLRHQGNRRFGRQVSELAIPIPKADRHEEEVHPSQPQQQLALVLRHHDARSPTGRVEVQDPGAAGVPLGEVACDIKPSIDLLGHALLARGDHGGAAASEAEGRSQGGPPEERHGRLSPMPGRPHRFVTGQIPGWAGGLCPL